MSRKKSTGLDSFLRVVGEAVKPVLDEVVKDTTESAKRHLGRAAKAAADKGVESTLRGAAGVLGPALKALASNPDAVDRAARSMIEAADGDWTLFKEDDKQKARRMVVAALRGFDVFLRGREPEPEDRRRRKKDEE